MTDKVLHVFEEDPNSYAFFCPGCQYGHGIRSARPPFAKPEVKIAVWTFNGDVDKPTFAPSYVTGLPDVNGNPFMVKRCHCYIENGQIRFLTDCWHELKGQTVDMVPF